MTKPEQCIVRANCNEKGWVHCSDVMHADASKKSRPYVLKAHEQTRGPAYEPGNRGVAAEQSRGEVRTSRTDMPRVHPTNCSSSSEFERARPEPCVKDKLDGRWGMLWFTHLSISVSCYVECHNQLTQPFCES